jgi:adenine-specific DNA-methyltransferase
MAKKVDSIRHQGSRAHIPSKEEAGYEDANEQVKSGKAILELPKNPVVHRGSDPELFWLNKYGNDDRDELLKVDIRSLYRHEHIAPEQLIRGLYRTVVEKKNENQMDLFSANELFGNALERDELEKVSEYYQHSDGWTNRLIQGDSLLVMSSLLEREGMAGQVQTIYIDPPYGIRYNSNWQMKLNDRNVKDGSDDHMTGEPEMIKAFRDTWELGVHTYLSYLRDRILITRELLSDCGSCFIQISDENVHLVRSVMDEVFGAENFFAQINYRSMSPLGQSGIAKVYDYIIWYVKDKSQVKFRPLFKPQDILDQPEFCFYDLGNGDFKKLNRQEMMELSKKEYPRIFKRAVLSSSGYTASCTYQFDFEGKTHNPLNGKSWRTHENGMKKLIEKHRLILLGKNPYFRQYYNDFPLINLENSWHDTAAGFSEAKRYVVQTNEKIIERCILMTSDPGDLVIDPTCGSGTTAMVAEEWGRRWITIDTSRIALNIAKTRISTGVFPYYKLYDQEGDIRQGFQYKKIPHITLKAIANDEPFLEEVLYDQPEEDKNRIRVSGPFTVETQQNFEPLPPDSFKNHEIKQHDSGSFEERIFNHLKSAGVRNGVKNEQAVFIRVEQLADSFLHAEGFYLDGNGAEKKAYFHIGPKFGTVARQAVNEAVKACRQRGDADWLIILGFSFESDIANRSVTTSVGSFEVTKVRMHDDLMQEGLLKKDRKAASFVTIGEPDIKLKRVGDDVSVEVCGLDIYDPIKDVVKARNIEDIAYWMVDDDYDGSNFVVTQIFFCGGEKDEFNNWRKGLESLAKDTRKREVERTLKIEIDDEAFDRLYGFQSHPILATKGKKIAVRVISQFGEESTKVLTVD